MGKKLSLLIITLLAFVMICSCAETPEITLNINKGIYDLSSCLPGFTQDSSCNLFRYKLKDIHLVLSVYDKAAPIESIESNGIDYFDKLTEHGMDYYYFKSGTVSSAGVDETVNTTIGEWTTVELIFYIDEYIVTLEGGTGDGDVSAVTLKLALDLLSKTPIDGLEPLGGSLSSRYYNGILECNVSLISKENAIYQNIFDTEKTVIKEEASIRYLESIRKQSPDDPNSRFIVCDTDKGALLISCGVPGFERNNVPAEALDFIDFSLAQDIAECLGVVITSIR